MKTSLGRAALALTLACTMFLVACSVDQVLSDIDVGLQIAKNLAPAVGTVLPEDALVLDTFTSVAIAGITAIKQTYDDASGGAASTKLARIQAIATALKSDLSQDLAAAHVTDTTLIATITNWVNLINSILNAVIAEISGAHVMLSTNPPKSGDLTPESIQARWTAEVCKGDLKCGHLVKAHHVHKSGFWQALGTGIGEWKFGG